MDTGCLRHVATPTRRDQSAEDLVVVQAGFADRGYALQLGVDVLIQAG